LACLDEYSKSAQEYQSAAALFRNLGTESDMIKAVECEIGALKCDIYTTDHRREVCAEILQRSKNSPHNNNPVTVRAWLILKAEACFLCNQDEGCSNILQEAYTLPCDWAGSFEEVDGLYYSARCHARKGRYREAVAIMDEAIQRFKELGVVTHEIKKFTQLVKARFLRGMSTSDEEILSVLDLALQETRQFGCHYAIGLTLQQFGDLYARRGDFAAAQVAYEGAVKELVRVNGFTARFKCESCLHNLGCIKARQVEPLDCSAFQYCMDY